MHNMQNMQFNTICKKYAIKYAAICRFSWYWCILTRICKICKIICKICKICETDFNMQNMHCPVCWWLSRTIRIISKPSYYYDTSTSIIIYYCTQLLHCHNSVIRGNKVCLNALTTLLWHYYDTIIFPIMTPGTIFSYYDTSRMPASIELSIKLVVCLSDTIIFIIFYIIFN